MEHSTKSLSPKLTCTSNLYKASLGEGGGGGGQRGTFAPPLQDFTPNLDCHPPRIFQYSIFGPINKISK